MSARGERWAVGETNIGVSFLAKLLGLAGGREDRTPPTAGGIETLRVRGEKFDGNMNETVVKQADHESGLACHRGVHGVTCEEVAKHRVLAVGRAASDLITRIEVAKDNGKAFGFEIGLNAFAEEQTDVF